MAVSNRLEKSTLINVQYTDCDPGTVGGVQMLQKCCKKSIWEKHADILFSNLLSGNYARITEKVEELPLLSSLKSSNIRVNRVYWSTLLYSSHTLFNMLCDISVDIGYPQLTLLWLKVKQQRVLINKIKWWQKPQTWTFQNVTYCYDLDEKKSKKSQHFKTSFTAVV